MKRLNLFLILLLTLFPLAAQQYKIDDVEYSITGCGHWIFGCTQEYALSNEVQIDKKTIFENETTFDAYLVDLEKRLKNLRAFETIELNYEPIAQKQEQDAEQESNLEPLAITPVKLKITVQDSFHLFAIPGPKYDSNKGLTFKLKIKDSNFLGSLNTLSSDIYFLIPTQESDGNSTEFGFNCTVDYPFRAGIFDAIWLNDLGLSYTIGDDMPEWNIRTGLRLTLPFDKTSLVFETNQRFVNNFEYQDFDDNLYFVNDFKFYVPLTIANLNYFGKLSYTPYTITSINWDHNGINKENSSLSSPIWTIGHKISFGRVDWNQNLRTGFTLSLDNFYKYNFQRKRLYPELEFVVAGYKKIDLLEDSYFFRNFGLVAKSTIFTFLFNPKKDIYIYNDGNSIGQHLRGIRDSQDYKGTNISSLNPTNAFILNFDLPVHIFTTNFTKSFLRYCNFDFQLSPFFDMALCYNKITQTYFSFEDGFYGAGLEVIVYPIKWSGITIRGSVGIDVGRKFLDNYINTEWRENVSKKEFSIGFGLHY